MKIALKPFLIFVGIAALLAAGVLVLKNFKNITPPASLLVETPNSQAEAFLDDQSLGPTPLQKDGLATGEHTLKLISGEQIYQTEIQLLPGTQTVVRREFGPVEVFGSGDVFYFEKTGRAASVSITTDPDGVQIKVDGRDFGPAPVLVEDLGAGTHDLHLSLEKFETRQLQIKVENGYQLRVSSKLTLVPLPTAELKEIDFGGEKVTVHNLSPNGTSLFVDAASLTKGIIYWVKTRGLGVAPIRIDYFVDSAGMVYDAEGKVFISEAFAGEPAETVAVGFLGNAGDENLSEAAKVSLTALTKKILKTPPLVDKVKILPTGTGWLRVRSEPSLSSAEMTRVGEGEKFALLSEQTGWAKIKLPDGKEGWVSADFVEKFQEAP